MGTRMITKLAILSFLAVLTIGGVLVLFSSQGPIQSHGKPVADVDVALTLSKIPRVGEIAQLSLSITPHKNASNVTAEIAVPNGIQVTSGDPFWEGELKANESITLAVKIKPLESGGYFLRGTFYNTPPPGDYGKTEVSGGNTAVIPLTTTPIFAIKGIVPGIWGHSRTSVKTEVQTNSI